MGRYVRRPHYDFDTRVKKVVDIDVDVNLDVWKTVDSFTVVYGNLATAEAGADAIGHDTLSETETFTKVIQDYASQSFSSSISAA